MRRNASFSPGAKKPFTRRNRSFKVITYRGGLSYLTFVPSPKWHRKECCFKQGAIIGYNLYDTRSEKLGNQIEISCGRLEGLRKRTEDFETCSANHRTLDRLA